LLVAGCALPAWLRQSPRFPPDGTAWDIPLYEPLTGFGPHVLATVAGRPAGGAEARRRREVLLYVDSGSSHSALPAATFGDIDVDTSTSWFATVEDAAGIKRSWSGALVPEMRLGDDPRSLTLADVVATVDDRTPLLGADVLQAHGWEIDPDLGRLRLGGQPWADAPGVVVVPTHSVRGLAAVDLRIAGSDVPLLVDTGAPFTVVNRDVLSALGLSGRRLIHPYPFTSGSGTAWLDTFYPTGAALAGIPLRQGGVLGLPAAERAAVRGMLGNDVLAGYAVQLVPGTLRLRPRAASVLEAVQERIARWRELPACPGAPGCVMASLVPVADGTARIHLRFLAATTRSWRYLFGCLDRAGRLRPIWVTIGVGQQGRESELDVDEPAAPPVFRRMWAEECSNLQLLDVNPSVPAMSPSVTEARFAADRRGLTIR
jgi:hypothetical protein